jgi:hypothetical protein
MSKTDKTIIDMRGVPESEEAGKAMCDAVRDSIERGDSGATVIYDDDDGGTGGEALTYEKDEKLVDLREPRPYEGPNGEKWTEDEFIADAEAMPTASKYKDRGAEYGSAAAKYYMEHGSDELQKQIKAVMSGQRRTMDPERLIEMGRLGAVFDETYDDGRYAKKVPTSGTLTTATPRRKAH